jgi:hypothetical protein
MKPSAEASPAQGPKMASDHVARLTLTAEGLKVLLPASSLRGALRSQAERILRTLRPEATGDPWGSVDREGLIERLFGHAGQRARLECADFLSTKPVGPPDSDPEKFVPRHPQEFVAIDRFTGGVAGAKKFDAEAVYRPSLVGTLSLPLDAVAPAALGLLALVLRDLSEGDITLGAKAAIGYGACRATITQIALTGRPPAGPWADLWPKTQDIDWSFVARQPLVVPEPVKLLVRGLVAEFRVQQGVSS